MQQLSHIPTSDLSASMAASSVSLSAEAQRSSVHDEQPRMASCGLLPQAAVDLLSVMFHKGRYGSVRVFALELLEEVPNSIFLLNVLGEAASQEKHDLDAVSHYQALIDCDPVPGEVLRKAAYLPNVHNNLSIALKNIGLLDEAEYHVKEALRLRPRFPAAFNTYGILLNEKADVQGAKRKLLKAIELNPCDPVPYWNLQSTASSIAEARLILEKAVSHAPTHQAAVVTLAGLRAFEGDRSHFDLLCQGGFEDDPIMRSVAWVLSLPSQPEIHFNRWSVFDRASELTERDRPFYEFGVWMGDSFRYLMRTHHRGFGFDTFSGLPEAWRSVPEGSYSSFGRIPEIEGAEFFVGEFDKTLPVFFAEPRPVAAVMNFDADLYSSTLSALTHAEPAIDEGTILIFDEFIVNPDWELDEYRALNEFCEARGIEYDVLAVSLFTKQVACRLRKPGL